MMKMKKYMILPVLALIFTFVLAAVNPIFAADDEIISGGNTETTLPPTSGTSGNGLIPNLVVSKFSFGGDQVYAGKAFTLSFHLKNTSKTFTVQNVVVKVNGGEIYGLNRDTDTLYFERIKANGTVECSADFISSAESAEGSYPITVTVSYEYYDDGAKCSNASEIKIAVPLAQEERVSINKAAMGSEDTTSPCICPPKLIPATCDLSHFSSSFFRPLSVCAYQSSGLCSAQPGRGKQIGYS